MTKYSENQTKIKITELLSMIPSFPQRQDSASSQLADLQVIANNLGMYDAADVISQWINHIPKLKYECCNIEENIDGRLGICDNCV